MAAGVGNQVKKKEDKDMKKRNGFIAALAVLAFAFSFSAWAATDENWARYDNGRFGYSAEYPDIFSKTEEPDNGDGVWKTSDDDNYRLTFSGGYNVLGDDGESRLKSRLEEVAHIVEGSDESGDGWYRVIYSDDGGRDGNEHLFYEYGIIDGENWASFILTYPLDEQERFAPIVERMEGSLNLKGALALPSSSGGESDKPNFGAYVLERDGVYKGGELLECEVGAVPSGLYNGVRAWAAFGPDTSESVPESDTGVWFFGDFGEKAKLFIPLDSEAEYQDLLWNGEGNRFVLVRGSGVRSDMFFEVYALPEEGPKEAAPLTLEKKAEFSGVRGQLAWLEDGMRFTFTRIDDTREETGELANTPYWLRLSAVLYDSTVDATTVLKESTDTQNFRFSSISEDGGNIVLSEEYVESPEDWADEDNVKTRDITVPIPPAG
jgi:hypothetical protein